MKTFIVTGGTGFMGREIITQLLKEHGDDCFIVSFSRAWDREKEFQDNCPINVKFMFGDVANKEDVERLFQDLTHFDIDAVFHTAAYKEIRSGENNVPIMVRTNVFGTANILEACVRHKVNKFVFTSTDKAVESINAYGNTKGICESLILSYSSMLNVSITRYGNVWASTGSVGDIWYKLAKIGNAVLDIHDPNMTRFWLTKQNAWDLINYARLHGTNGSIYVPLAKSTTIGDLANVYHSLFGLNSRRTRLIPGEKEHEKMIVKTEKSLVLDNGFVEIGVSGKTGMEYASNTCEKMTSDELTEMILKYQP